MYLKKTIPFIALVLSFFVSAMPLLAQETLSGLEVNSALQGQKPIKKTKGTGVLSLPFLDDFSATKVIPNQQLWQNANVFINHTFPVAPITYGVATFDALNEKGALYENASTTPFIADYLTSQPIDMALLSPADSVYLSFYYQPGGGMGAAWEMLGEAPNTKDSLVLEVLYVGDSIKQFTLPTSTPITAIYTLGDSLLNTYTNLWTKVDPYLKPNIYVVLPSDSLWLTSDSILVIVADTFFLVGDSILYDSLSAKWSTIDSVMVTPKSVLLPGDLVELKNDSIWVQPSKWVGLWSTAGLSLTTFYQKHKTYFKQILIPVTNPYYFHENFQFRFKNYASLSATDLVGRRSGQIDHWHLDYVYLNKNRHSKDTTLMDLGLTTIQENLLHQYTAIPFDHFMHGASQEMIDSIGFSYRNLSNTDNKQTQRIFSVLDENGVVVHTKTNNQNVVPLAQSYFSLPSTYTYNSTQYDSVVFTLVSQIKTELDTLHMNDSITAKQIFYNYYAYDDGTPENGYGIGGEQAMVGYGFQLKKQDTLRALDIYVNQTFNQDNQEGINLMVWNDNNGVPGSLLYKSTELVTPVYADSLHGYHTYPLEFPIAVAGKIYIGWQQPTDIYLNIGFDRNNNAQPNLFYNTTGSWQSSLFSGALMLRPVLGKVLPLSMVEKKEPVSYRLYPNPAHHQVHIEALSINPSLTTIKVYNHVGMVVLEQPYTPILTIDTWPSGCYLIEISDSTHIYRTKLMVTK